MSKTEKAMWAVLVLAVAGCERGPLPIVPFDEDLASLTCWSEPIAPGWVCYDGTRTCRDPEGRRFDVWERPIRCVDGKIDPGCVGPVDAWSPCGDAPPAP